MAGEVYIPWRIVYTLCGVSRPDLWLVCYNMPKALIFRRGLFKFAFDIYFKVYLKSITMNKVRTLSDLKKMRDEFRSSLDLRERSDSPESQVQIKVSMATCGIAAGAKEVMSYLIAALARDHVDALVTQTGCMGYCYAEPTIQVIVPGRPSVVFGYVNQEKVDEIIHKFIQEGTLVDGIIPETYTAVNNE